MTTMRSPSDVLLPCPFCGGKPRRDPHGNSYVSCKCLLRSDHYPTYNVWFHIDDWNRRAALSAGVDAQPPLVNREPEPVAWTIRNENGRLAKTADDQAEARRWSQIYGLPLVGLYLAPPAPAARVADNAACAHALGLELDKVRYGRDATEQAQAWFCKGWDAARASAPPAPSGWTERHSKVQRYALRRFMHEAHARANEAAQDKRDPSCDKVNSFMDDAKTAEECLTMLAPLPPLPAKEPTDD